MFRTWPASWLSGQVYRRGASVQIIGHRREKRVGRAGVRAQEAGRAKRGPADSARSLRGVLMVRGRFRV